MTVPFLDLHRLHDSIRPELDAVFDRVLSASAFVGGEEVSTFETSFAAAHDAAGAVGCGSGTDALSLALRALDVGPGDEVVVPSMTFVATAEAVVHVGATPVIADVDARTLLLSEETVAAVRTPATRAVIPVHLYGHVVPFDTLTRWRNEGLIVLEDAAQAHLASWGDRYVGSVGHAATFSFYPGKNLGALGDGGAVISADQEVLDRVRRLRDHGRATKYTHDEVGWCSRLDSLQAAFLAAKLPHLATWTEGRRAVAAEYARRLPPDALVPWESGAVHHLLVVEVDERDRVQRDLRAAGIPTGVHYPVAVSQQPAFASWAKPTPNAERAASRVLSLPMDPMMMTDDVVAVFDAVVGTVNNR